MTRTVLPRLRLSEDIDLVVDPEVSRAESAAHLEVAFARAVARTHGRLHWEPRLVDTISPHPAVATTSDGLSVQVQLVSGAGYPQWPSEMTIIEQRYRDVAPAELRVLTAAGFVAAKTAAWFDRHAPRDLYDLWALAHNGHIDDAAAQVYRAVGPTGRIPAPVLFDRFPSPRDWRAALAHQCRLAIAPDEALCVVAARWSCVA